MPPVGRTHALLLVGVQTSSRGTLFCFGNPKQLWLSRVVISSNPAIQGALLVGLGEMGEGDAIEVTCPRAGLLASVCGNCLTLDTNRVWS